MLDAFDFTMTDDDDGAFNLDKAGSMLFREEDGIDPTVASLCCSAIQ